MNISIKSHTPQDLIPVLSRRYHHSTHQPPPTQPPTSPPAAIEFQPIYLQHEVKVFQISRYTIWFCLGHGSSRRTVQCATAAAATAAAIFRRTTTVPASTTIPTRSNSQKSFFGQAQGTAIPTPIAIPIWLPVWDTAPQQSYRSRISIACRPSKYPHTTPQFIPRNHCCANTWILTS